MSKVTKLILKKNLFFFTNHFSGTIYYIVYSSNIYLIKSDELWKHASVASYDSSLNQGHSIIVSKIRYNNQRSHHATHTC